MRRLACSTGGISEGALKSGGGEQLGLKGEEVTVGAEAFKGPGEVGLDGGADGAAGGGDAEQDAGAVGTLGAAGEKHVETELGDVLKLAFR